VTYRVLLYYQFIHIDDPESFAPAHREFCASLNLRGRIIIAAEGLNGTVSGTWDNTEAYMQTVHKDPRFASMVFKFDATSGHVFPRLTVKVRNEIVSLHSTHSLDVNRRTGVYLEPVDFMDRLQEQDVVIMDVRNRYEFEMGHFRHAINPPVSSFREFPEWFENHRNKFSGKAILTYCTGGIRCEKFTAYLRESGFDNVFQLHGGIDAYRKDPKTRGALFDGDCFVFDERLRVRVNSTTTASTLTHCLFCGVPSTRWLNCANLDCHRSFYACSSCERKTRRSCSAECQASGRHEYLVKGDALYNTPLTERGLFSNPHVAEKYK